MGKKLKGLLLALVLCLQVVVPAAKADAATVLYNNATGYEGNYAYELWKDYGSTSMTLKGKWALRMLVAGHRKRIIP